MDEEATAVTDATADDPDEALVADEEGNALGDAASSATVYGGGKSSG